MSNLVLKSTTEHSEDLPLTNLALQEMDASSTEFGVEMLCSIIGDLNIGVIVCNPVFEVLLCNHKATELIGMSAAQLRTCTDFYQQRDIIQEDGTPFSAALNPSYIAAATKKPVKNVTMGMLHPGKGDTVWLLVTAVPALDQLGGLKHITISFTDITESKMREKALLVSKSNLIKAQRIGHIGSWEWNLQTGLINWSDEMTRIVGYGSPITIDELRAMLLNAMHPEDLPTIATALSDAEQYGTATPLELRLVQEDGSVKYVSLQHGELISDSDGKPLMLNGTIQDVTRQKEWANEIKRLNVELKELTRHLQQVRTAEINKFAVEVHDKLGQNLVALRLQVEKLMKDGHEADSPLVHKLAELSGDIKAMIDDFKQIYYEVNPTLLEHMDLQHCIEYLVQGFTKTSSIRIQFANSDQVTLLPYDVKLSCYKIVQECLNNVRFHSNANTVDVSLATNDDQLVITVQDNGIGFDPSAIDISSNHGILEIRERVSAIKGELVIETGNGQGTTIIVRINLISA